MIHNYFFAKSIDTLKPNGVLAMVVTNYFMDSQDSKARRYIARRANLLGAIRLPNNAFLKNAGTEVTTDIVILQKRAEPLAAVPSEDDVAWTKVVTHTDKEGRTVPLNKFFVNAPEMMLGEFGAYGTMYRGDSAALIAREGDDLPAMLNKAIASLPSNIMDEPAPIAEEVVAVPDTVETAMVGSAFLAPMGRYGSASPTWLASRRPKKSNCPTRRPRNASPEWSGSATCSRDCAAPRLTRRRPTRSSISCGQSSTSTTTPSSESMDRSTRTPTSDSSATIRHGRRSPR